MTASKWLRAPTAAAAAGRTPEGGLGLDSQKYVEQGLPADCADFVYVCMEGREGSATMSEYFHMLEVRVRVCACVHVMCVRECGGWGGWVCVLRGG